MRDGYQGIKDAGAAEMIAMSSDTTIGAANTRRQEGIPFLLLSDEDLVAINAYNVLNPDSRFFAHPVAYIVDEDGKIVWKDVGRRFGHRTNSGQIIAALNDL